jgi:hypothetical protein
MRSSLPELYLTLPFPFAAAALCACRSPHPAPSCLYDPEPRLCNPHDLSLLLVECAPIASAVEQSSVCKCRGGRTSAKGARKKETTGGVPRRVHGPLRSVSKPSRGSPDARALPYDVHPLPPSIWSALYPPAVLLFLLTLVSDCASHDPCSRADDRTASHRCANARPAAARRPLTPALHTQPFLPAKLCVRPACALEKKVSIAGESVGARSAAARHQPANDASLARPFRFARRALSRPS